MNEAGRESRRDTVRTEDRGSTDNTVRPLPPRVPRASYAALSPYVPERPAVEHDLSENTNQWGAPPSALAAIRQADAGALTGYPAQPTNALLDAIARYVGVGDRSTITTGCGSDDLLDCVMRALAEPGDRVAFSWPTFTMIPYFASTNGLEPVRVPFGSDWDVDADALLAARARVTYLCAPNNPTGTPIRAATVERVLREAEGVVVIDEAYAEFAGESWAHRAVHDGRLIVTRTLSKAFGLAGLRIGYAVAAPALLHEIEKARGPYKVTALTDVAATAAVTHDVAWMQERVRDAVAAREWLRAALVRIGLAPLPSASNFLLVPVHDAAAIASHVARGGILVRAFRDLAGIGDAIRITAAPLPVLERCVSLLEEALALRPATSPSTSTERA